MSKIGNAVRKLEYMDELARKDGFVNRIHPLVKLWVTVLYLVLVVSFDGRQLTGLLGMALYPFFVFEMTGLSFRDALYRMRIVLPLVCLIGIFNPIFDREPALELAGFAVTEGTLTFVSLMIKGVLTVLASYLLVATTSIDDLCIALRKIHIPKMLVTEFLLICRYISLLLREVEHMTASYALRAPRQKGIAFHSWGPMVGQLLLRSIDRANTVYQSMCLRGYETEMYYGKPVSFRLPDALYLAGVTAALVLLKLFPVLELIGGLITR